MNNNGINYIKNMQNYFQPKTPFSALRAAKEGLLPPEAFIYKTTSIEPIADNPDNLEEIERILGQKERDFETNMLLITILGRLIKNPDKEIALFAAESINAIENDYNRAIEKIAPDNYKKKAVIYTEMAELNKAVPDLKNFYLREAFSNYRKLEKNNNADVEDLLNMSRILIKLNMLSQAKKILYDKKLKGIEARFVLADIAFRNRSYTELYSIMRRLNEHRSMMDVNQTDIIDYWLGIE